MLGEKMRGGSVFSYWELIIESFNRLVFSNINGSAFLKKSGFVPVNTYPH